ncbi:MAG: PstS family phosphate ABC transporter substrate-binding protein [Cyanobacteria bacterium SBLK]|nr:PstS family phosphate ABC transporter substrate-binding protein [Cyanobacteria bacterium SBLK]
MILRYKTIAFIVVTLALMACDETLVRVERERQYQIINSKFKEPQFVDPLPEFVSSPNTNSEETNPQLTQLPEIDPLTVEGDMNIAGSSTVFPLSEAMYDRFVEDGYTGTIKLSSIGSGSGFRLFCQAGETDISNASRPIKDTEIAACQDIDRQPIQFRVGIDALAVVVHPENEFLNDVTKEELRTIFTAERWSDINPDWPDENIIRFIPDVDSGTLDFFVEELEEEKETLITAPDTQANADDEILLRGVAQNPYAIGFFGYAYYQSNRDSLKSLAIEGIQPSQTAVENGTYLFSRPLFIYSDAKIMQEKPQVAAFINYFLTHVNEEIRTVGYFPANARVANSERVKFLQAIGE